MERLGGGGAAGESAWGLQGSIQRVWSRGLTCVRASTRQRAQHKAEHVEWIKKNRDQGLEGLPSWKETEASVSWGLHPPLPFLLLSSLPN